MDFFNTGITTAAVSVLWMGILATLSPCPLATNIAAISIIAGGGGRTPQSAIMTAAAYGVGRMLVHALLGVVIMKGIASASETTLMLQGIPSKISGPLFIILGVILSGWLDIRMPKGSSALKKKILGGNTSGPWRTFLVGCIFSLIPCPETAALFFGGLLPMATAQGSMYLLPLLFGLGTALPVMAAGFLMSMGVSGFAARLGGIRSAEVWLRAITCTAFIGIGFYLTLSHVYHVI